jgi:hypothetical protein
VNTLYCLEEWRDEQKISPPGDKIHPRGQSLPLGAKLRMGLWIRSPLTGGLSVFRGRENVLEVRVDRLERGQEGELGLEDRFDGSVSAVIFRQKLIRAK